MKKLVKKLYANSLVRYIFFGGCTTLVNMAIFYAGRKAGLGLHVANILSIVTAILFAYVVNALFVFEHKCTSLTEHLGTFGKFIGARAITMVIEIFGVWVLVEVMTLPDMAGKFIVQFIVIIVNYLLSKFLVFTSARK
ncbi:MAG: GtrA family protein [Eubacteriales bacterium]|nr:GtrA family protein [Eubacteriales bacterium]